MSSRRHLAAHADCVDLRPPSRFDHCQLSLFPRLVGRYKRTLLLSSIVYGASNAAWLPYELSCKTSYLFFLSARTFPFFCRFPSLGAALLLPAVSPSPPFFSFLSLLISRMQLASSVLTDSIVLTNRAKANHPKHPSTAPGQYGLAHASFIPLSQASVHHHDRLSERGAASNLEFSACKNIVKLVVAKISLRHGAIRAAPPPCPARAQHHTDDHPRAKPCSGAPLRRYGSKKD